MTKEQQEIVDAIIKGFGDVLNNAGISNAGSLRYRTISREKSKEENEELDEIIGKQEELNKKLKDASLTEEERKKYQEEYLKNQERENYLLEERGKRFQSRLQNIKYSLNSIVKTFQNFNDAWAKADQAAANYTRTLGGTAAAMDRLRKNTIDNVVKKGIGINYNMSIDELLKAQEAYTKAVGRNLRIDNTQQENLAALSKVMGPEGATQMAAAFENFGLSLNGTAVHAGRMFKEASEYGISFDKYSQNVRENISIAQNYTFKNGLAGLESMARKATAIKLDMKQIEALAGKVNTVEGAIGTAAKLQVLGGPFAAMSNPLDMLNESLTDMEGLMDRFVKMTGGLGQFNKATGEVNVSAFNKQRIRIAAEAMGMDYNQVMTSIQASARRNEVEKQLRQSGNPNQLNEKMMELVKNTATFENGKAGVSINGVFKEISELKNTDYGELVKETQSQASDVKDIARTLRGLVDKREGYQKQLDANRARISERMGLGKGESMILDKLGHSNTLLTIIAAASGLNSLFGGIDRLFGGRINRFAGRLSRGIGRSISRGFGRISGRTVTGAAPRIVGKGILPSGSYVKGSKAFNAAGKQLHGAAANNVFKAVGNTPGVAVKGTKTIVQTGGSTIFKGGFTRSANRLGLKMFGRGGLRTAGKFAGPLAGATEGIFTAIDEFGGNKNYGTGKKIGRTVGSTAGGIGGGLAAGAAIGSFAGPVGALIGGAIGAIAGSSVGKWIGGGFASQERRARKKNEFGLDELKGDYSVKKLKKIEEALETGVLDADLRREIKSKGDVEVLSKVKAAKEANKEQVGKNIAEAYFTVENAYFGEGGMVRKQENVSRGKISEEKQKTAGKDFLDSASWGVLSPMAFLIKRAKHTGAGEEMAKLNPTTYSPIGIVGQMLKGESAFKKERRETTEATTTGGGYNGPKVPSSISINVNGAIKLTDSQGKSFDIAGQLLNDDAFIRKLSGLIAKQVNISESNNNYYDKTAQMA